MVIKIVILFEGAVIHESIHPKVLIGFSVPGPALTECPQTRDHLVRISCRGIYLSGLTTNKCASIVPRLEHGAFLVLTCGGALLVETGRGINVIVA